MYHNIDGGHVNITKANNRNRLVRGFAADINGMVGGPNIDGVIDYTMWQLNSFKFLSEVDIVNIVMSMKPLIVYEHYLKLLDRLPKLK
jgi:hypothetical protein